MVPLDKIRSDLKEIRYYYSRKAMFDECKNIVTEAASRKKYGGITKPLRLHRRACTICT